MDTSIIYRNKRLVMLVCVLVTAATLNQYAKLVAHLIRVEYDWKFELLMVLGQLLFQLPFILRYEATEKWNYYYHMLSVSAMGSLALLPLILMNLVISLGDLINLGYFSLVVSFMFFDHKRRVRQLGLPSYISYTWVVYRFLILIFLLLK